MTKHFVCIDWLSFTSQQQWYSGPPPLPLMGDTYEYKHIAPRFGYRQAVQYRNGQVTYFDGSTKTMGTHYVYSGSAIKNISAEYNDGGLAILGTHLGEGHKCTRIDLAIDIMDDPDILADTLHDARNEGFKGTAKKLTIVEDAKGNGCTIYAGSRTSERFVRVYDKAAQMKQPGLWTRIECEVKGDSARAVARACIQPDTGGVGVVAKSIIRRVVVFQNQAYRRAVLGAYIEIGSPDAKESDTKAWILGQVAKAIANFDRAHPEEKIVEQLMDKLYNQLLLPLDE